MAGHPYVGQVRDPATAAALNQAFDVIAELKRTVAALQASALQNTAAISANGQRLTNLADATGAQDAVNLQTLRRLVAGQVESF